MLTPVKLLLIDDQPSFVRGLTRLLQRDGYRVETAANGQEALARLTAHPYDVIVCDLQMPTLDGRTFYSLLQWQFPPLAQRVLFVTGDTLGGDSTAFLAQCGQPYLYKPCTAAAVRSTLQQLLDPGSHLEHEASERMPHVPLAHRSAAARDLPRPGRLVTGRPRAACRPAHPSRWAV
jgi:CheY-like chemotaxis protein